MECYEYIWIDGTKPSSLIRSKTRIQVAGDWNFDGSSCNQDIISDKNEIVSNKWYSMRNFLGFRLCGSDVKLSPVRYFYSKSNESRCIVLCECLSHDNAVIDSNTRRLLSSLDIDRFECKIGFEQEYVICDSKTRLPLGFSGPGQFPSPQGGYYCGVGAARALGRAIADTHMRACIDFGINIYGTNAEVLCGQWEFQVGPCCVDDIADPLTMADHLWVARYLLERIAEDYGCIIDYSCKPVHGDWNGSGCHTNFSTKMTRDPASGVSAIMEAIRLLGENRASHIDSYGHGVKDRLTGKHETCAWNVFRCGVGDRGASIRIPRSVYDAGCGYIEDRRPGANCDPYVVASKLVKTICFPTATSSAV